MAWHGPQLVLWEFRGGVVGPAALGLLSVRGGRYNYLVTPVAAEAFVDLEELSRYWMQLNRPA